MAYRSRGPAVDDTLFASKRNTKGGSSRLPPSATIVTRRELDAIKAHSTMWTQADEDAKRASQEQAQEDKHRAARDRKERMLMLEANAKAKSRKSDMELEREARKMAVRGMADKALDENLDLVKMLNTLGSRAAAFTIRDEQLAEKEVREAKKKDYEDRQDVLMEIDRLTELQKRDELEAVRREKRIEDRQVIVEQIDARRKKKLYEEELVEQDNQTMLALVGRYKADDERAVRAHREDVVRSRKEVMSANDLAIHRKEVAKQRERDEEEAILLYQASKDEAMRVREEDEKAREHAMKERQARLLSQQEKTQNKQAEVDELRARRYAEERERRERERELTEAELKSRRAVELQDARSQQAEQKKRVVARECVAQRDEYERSLRHANEVVLREKREAEAKHKEAHAHRDVLQEQIAKAEHLKSAKSRVKLEEGRKLKSEFLTERCKLEAIRDKMVTDMEKKGYNPKYLSEMRACDIEKLQMR